MLRKILLCGREIEYELERKSVKNINLRIRKDSSVYVSANRKVSIKTIEEFIVNKSDFILSALDRFSEIQQRKIPEYRYVDGEIFYYLGEKLILKIEKGKNSISLNKGILTIYVTDTTDEKLKKSLVDKWYDKNCKLVFEEIIAKIYPVFKEQGVKFPVLKMRFMTARWGSCRPKSGIITLNKHLLRFPKVAIEYVVMHEFVHFLQPNHSKLFYEKLENLMPDWLARKNILSNSDFVI